MLVATEHPNGDTTMEHPTRWRTRLAPWRSRLARSGLTRSRLARTRLADDEGSATAEYAIATMATVVAIEHMRPFEARLLFVPLLQLIEAFLEFGCVHFLCPVGEFIRPFFGFGY